MLDDVERRRFLVQPTREDSSPTLVAPLHIDLHECAGQLLLLPGGRGLAGAKANDDILPSRRLTGMKRDILDDAVALVENPENRDTLRHRRDAVLPRHGRPGAGRRNGRALLLLRALAARGERQRNEQRCRVPFHAYSGIQGS
jgi:hypothetical protein